MPASFRPRAHHVPVHPVAVAHRREVARWALARGHRVGRDALAVLVALRTDPVLGTMDLTWTERRIDLTLELHVPRWCARHGVERPAEIGRTLASYLRFLAAHQQLALGSDPPAVLRRAVAEHCDAELARRRRHPAARLATVRPIG